MIDHLNISLLKPEELITISERLIELVATAKIENPLIGPALQLIKEKKALLEQAVSRQAGSAYTAQVRAQDRRRDKMFIGFRTMLRAYTYQVDEQLSETAEALLEVLGNYGSTLHRENDNIQTAKMKMMAREMLNDTYKPMLNKLKVMEWFNTMNKENEVFEKLTQERNSEQAEKISVSIQSAKSALGNLLNSFFDTLEIFQQTGGLPTQNSLVPEINEMIGDANISGKARQSREQTATNNDQITEGK